MFKLMALNLFSNMNVIQYELGKLDTGITNMGTDFTALSITAGAVVGVAGGIICMFNSRLGKTIVVSAIVGVILVALFNGGIINSIYNWFS